jgi:predicted TPR repeat methyltransferase
LDLLAALDGEPPRNYDVVTAGDVFIYVGNLDRVIPSIRRVIRTGGVFAFTVEAAEDDTPALGAADNSGYLLRDSGLYAHSAQYLEKLAALHDFKIQLRRRISLRLKGTAPGPMMGWLDVWRATAPRGSE